MSSLTGFRARLREPRPIIATFSILGSPVIVELIGRADFEAVVLDLEHGPLGPESMSAMIPAARSASLTPLVRVRTNEASLIGQALDAGAAGVLVPQIASAREAEAAVTAARFAPDGTRGANPFVRAAHYTAGPEYYSAANRDAAVLVMVEGTAGLDALPEILEVPGLDGVFIGPFDLSQSLGVRMVGLGVDSQLVLQGLRAARKAL